MLLFKKPLDLLSENNLILPGLLVLILIIPAFFINLGITPFIEDEATRGLVSLEMHLSGNYITPTIGGSLYYNKPPLFNWLVVLFYKTGGTNELMVRLPTVISLLLFALTMFLSVKKHLGNRVAFTSALIFLTCGRILTYESLKGLIDIIFSWVLFMNFMVLYNGLKSQRLLQAFLKSYLLFFVAFMFKGIPALVFQALTVITLLFYFYRWRMFYVLFSLRHIIGIGVFLVLTGIYYGIYFSNNPGTANEMFSIIFQQSARRTALRFGIGAMITHLITYPFEFISHFLPWTLLAVLFFFKKSRQMLNDKFISALIWVFLINITVYWASPESFARYVLMLVPMIYIVLVYMFENTFTQQNIIRFFYYGFLTCMILIILTTISIPFLPAVEARTYVIPKVIFLLFFQGLILYLYFKNPGNALINTAIFLLVVRIGFNWFVLTHRVDHMSNSPRKAVAQKIGEFARTHEVYVYGEPFKYYNEDTSIKYISFFTRFYISAEAGKIIRDENIIKPGCFYLVKKEDVEGKMFLDYSEIGITGDKVPRFLVQFK